MPGKVKVKVIAGKNLPVMDRSNDTTDAYVEVKLGNVTFKTDVCRKSLNPQWNSEWFRFEMDDLELQDEPLQIRLMDHDTYSANDSIGKVYIDLNPLLTNPSKTKEPSGRSMSGWIPVYDTMHGIRGEVNLMVKVELFSDLNKFRQSSCGVKFFFSSNIPEGHQAIQLHGFVEELVVNDDPEYQWIDKIRTPRASNEARQTLFSKLSGEVQRRVGLKALELGGNAVIGYKQCFDLEGESGIVVRGIGTAATLTKSYDTQLSPIPDRDGNAAMSGGGSKEEIQAHDEVTQVTQLGTSNTLPPSSAISEPIPEEQTSSNENSAAEAKIPAGQAASSNQPAGTNGRVKGSLKDQSHGGSATNMSQPLTAPRTLSSVSPSKGFGTHHHNGIGTNGRRSSESDLSTPPKGILNSSIQAILSGPHGKGPTFAPSRRPAASSDHFDMLEYPFITIYDLPPKFIQRIGGSVSARSVKLLERISNLDEPESRDLWWTEIRMEIRSHARSICCNVVLGYEEHTTICDDVCILSATGTAAVVNSAVLGDTSEASSKFNLVPLPDSKLDKEQRMSTQRSTEQNGVSRTLSFSGGSGATRHVSGDEPNCFVCHIPYNETGAPFAVKMARCGVCKKARVPDLMLATINIPTGVPVTGKSCLIQAQVFRQKKDCKGESSAKEVSDSLPFLEYELHRRLINKLKVKGMNAIFCLNVQICLGENLIMATATGTALCLTGLPTPELPKITAGNTKTDTQKVCQFQKVVQDAFDRNREFYKVTPSPNLGGQGTGESDSSENESEDDSPLMNLATGNKDTYVLEVDDSEDIEIISELIDPSPPSIGFDMSNLEHVLGYDDFTISKQQMFIHVWRCRIPSLSLRQLSAHFDRILRSISFKLRSMRPCILTKIRLRLELPEADEMQVCVTGTALGLKEKMTSLPSESRSGSNTVLATSTSHSPMLQPKGCGGDENGEMIFNLECEGKHTLSGECLGESSLWTVPRTCTTVVATSNPVTAIMVSSPSASHLSRLNSLEGSESMGKGAGGGAKFCPSGCPLTTQNSLNRYIPSAVLNKIPLLPPTPCPHLEQGGVPIPVCSIPPLARSRSSTNTGIKARGIIEITTLSHIPGQRIEKYLGNLNFFFIRETTSIKEMGGPTGFVHSFVMEVTAILRGHVSALGGNALVSFFMTELSLLYNPHKNQGQCLISVGGDAVLSLPPNPTSTIQDE